MTTKKRACCHVQTAFGQKLSKAIILVGISGSVIAGVTFFYSALTLGLISWHTETQGRHLLRASHLLAAVVLCPMSLHQLVLSLLLCYRKYSLKGNLFVCSLWFTSHLSILFIYAILLGLKSVACFYFEQYVCGAITLSAILVYEALYIYFEIIVNSYMDFLGRHRNART